MLCKDDISVTDKPVAVERVGCECDKLFSAFHL